MYASTTRHLAFLVGLVVPMSAQRPVPADVLAPPAEGMVATNAPGCSLAITREPDETLIWANGAVDLVAGHPITDSTVLYGGSVSKQFVAMMVALLSERGALDFDDPVRRWIPELGRPAEGVTLRHLLHHTSGLRDYLWLAGQAGRDYADNFSNAEALALVYADTTADSEPGARYRYSNTGYLLLAEVVSRASRMSFARFANREIFDPLGMRDSHFHDKLDHTIGNLAMDYRATDSGWVAWPLAFAAVGSGGLYTSARDMARWSHNWFANRIGSGQPLIDTLLTRGVLTSGDTIPYALGMVRGEYRGLQIREHTGGLAAYRSAILQFPAQGLGLVMLCNSDQAEAGILRQLANGMLFEDFVDDATDGEP
jgi:CubicO group peptidase (beta-lactamase class C family)